MNELFKLKELTIKNDMMTIDFSGNQNLLVHFIHHCGLKEVSFTVGSVEKSECLSEELISKIDDMVLVDDPTVFTDLAGIETECATAEDFSKHLLYNLPNGVLVMHLQLMFKISLLEEVLEMFGFVPLFQKELESRLSQLNKYKQIKI